MNGSFWQIVDEDGEETMTWVENDNVEYDGTTTNIPLIDMQTHVELKFIKTHEDAVLPAVNNNENKTGDSGYDLTAVETVEVPPGGSAVVPVGLKLGYVTPGYWFRIEPRSGLGFKSSIQPHLGVIDNGYRGDMGVKLYNFSDKFFTAKKGDRIAQLVVYELLQPAVSWTDEATESNRGEKGFGSSDKC